MQKKILLWLVLFTFLIYSCRKEDHPPPTLYEFERINKNNFNSLGWKEQQVNIASGITTFSDQSNYVEIVCGPENNSNPHLKQGSIAMNLPTSDDPTLRRMRLRRGGYSATRLADLTELKYSTYVMQNAPTTMVLQVEHLIKSIHSL